MRSGGKTSCLACGEPSGSCVRCKAQKWNEPWRPLGLPAALWLALIIGAAITSVLWHT